MKCDAVKDPLSSWISARYLNSSVDRNCYLRRFALWVGCFDRVDLSPNVTKTEPSPSVKKLGIGIRVEIKTMLITNAPISINLLNIFSPPCC